MNLGFRWYGGKQKLSQEILKHVPRSGRKCIDLFAGRANLFLNVAASPGHHYDEYVLNDIVTFNFFEALRDYDVANIDIPERNEEERRKLACLYEHGDPRAVLLAPLMNWNGGLYDSGGATTEGGRQSPESFRQALIDAQKIIREKQPKITRLDWYDCLEAEQLDERDCVMIDAPYIDARVRAYEPDWICPTELIEYLRNAKFRWVFTEYRRGLYVEGFGEPVFQKNVQCRGQNFKFAEQQRRVECIWTSENLPKRCSATVQAVPEDRSDVYYSGLSTDDLLSQIKECAASITASRNLMQREMRKRLLPALQELKKRTYRKKPGYYDLLRAINLDPSTVRSWFYRSHTADEVIEMLEPEEKEPEWDDDDRKSAAELLLLRADRIASANLRGKHDLATRLSAEYAKARRVMKQL